MCNPAYPETETTICLDFDGVIHNDDKGYHDGTVYGNPVEGTYEALKEISKHVNIIIQSTKARKDRPLVDGKTGVSLIWEWLNKWDLKQFIVDVVSEKPPAYKYVDDKGYNFNSWQVTMQILRMGKLWKKS